MHDVIVNELEQYLAISAGSVSAAFHDHLASCAACRAEVESMAGMAELLAEFRAEPEWAPEPSPFFYTRVAAGILERERTEHWGLLAPGAAFFRRVAFASLLLLAGLGSYLVSRESNFAGTDAATIIAAHDVTVAHPESSDRDLMLVTLAGYRE